MMKFEEEEHELHMFVNGIRILVISGIVILPTILILGLFAAIWYNIRWCKKAFWPESKTGEETKTDVERNQSIKKTDDNEVSGAARFKAGIVRVMDKNEKSGIIKVMDENGKHIWISGWEDDHDSKQLSNKLSKTVSSSEFKKLLPGARNK